MNEGLVQRLPMHLLNSTCSSNILVKNCDSSTAQNLLQLLKISYNPPPPPKKEEDEAKYKKMKNQNKYQFKKQRI